MLTHILFSLRRHTGVGFKKRCGHIKYLTMSNKFVLIIVTFSNLIF